MIRLFFKLASLLVLSLAALVGLIRARPYDDSDLRTLLMPPEGCPMPCWAGIRPGVTTMGQASRLLSAHPWVGKVTVNLNAIAFRSGNIIWEWSGQQPPVVDGAQSGVLTIQDDVVEFIMIPTTLRFGEVWLLLGQPDDGYLDPGYLAHFHGAAYLGGALRVHSQVPCGLQPADFWGARVTLQLTDAAIPDFYEYDLHGWLYRPPPCRPLGP